MPDGWTPYPRLDGKDEFHGPDGLIAVVTFDPKPVRLGSSWTTWYHVTIEHPGLDGEREELSAMRSPQCETPERALQFVLWTREGETEELG